MQPKNSAAARENIGRSFQRAGAEYAPFQPYEYSQHGTEELI
jgi:hypothetical protein